MSPLLAAALAATALAAFSGPPGCAAAAIDTANSPGGPSAAAVEGAGVSVQQSSREHEHMMSALFAGRPPWGEVVRDRRSCAQCMANTCCRGNVGGRCCRRAGCYNGNGCGRCCAGSFCYDDSWCFPAGAKCVGNICQKKNPQRRGVLQRQRVRWQQVPRLELLQRKRQDRRLHRLRRRRRLCPRWLHLVGILQRVRRVPPRQAGRVCVRPRRRVHRRRMPRVQLLQHQRKDCWLHRLRRCRWLCRLQLVRVLFGRW